ncbi:MAG: adenylyl-sulfate kinase [Telluria sp.]
MQPKDSTAPATPVAAPLPAPIPAPLAVTGAMRSAIKGQRPCVLWFTGLSAAGKSTIANLVELALNQQGQHTYLLDGDNMRQGLCRDLDFSAAGRSENSRRMAEVSRLMADAGLLVITAFISPFRADRDAARALLADVNFIEVFADAPLAHCEARDPKGLYARARRGELAQFTGIGSPYEAPLAAEIHLDTASFSAHDCAARIVDYLDWHDYLGRQPSASD